MSSQAEAKAHSAPGNDTCVKTKQPGVMYYLVWQQHDNAQRCDPNISDLRSQVTPHKWIRLRDDSEHHVLLGYDALTVAWAWHVDNSGKCISGIHIALL